MLINYNMFLQNIKVNNAHSLSIRNGIFLQGYASLQWFFALKYSYKIYTNIQIYITNAYKLTAS